MLPNKKIAPAVTEQERLRKLEKQMRRLSIQNGLLIFQMFISWVIWARLGRLIASQSALIIGISDLIISLQEHIQLISENIDCFSKGLNMALEALDILQMGLLCL